MSTIIKEIEDPAELSQELSTDTAPEIVEQTTISDAQAVINGALTQMTTFCNTACERGAYNLVTAHAICEQVNVLSELKSSVQQKTDAIKVLLEALSIAQKKGLFSFSESADINNAINVVIIKK